MKFILLGIFLFALAGCNNQSQIISDKNDVGLSNCHQIGVNRYENIIMPVFECKRGNKSVLAIYDGGNSGWRIEDGN